MATKSLLAVLVLAGTAAAQPAPQKLTIGIYAPSVDFGTSQARLAYVQGLAKAIESNTGIRTEAQSYVTIAALKQEKVDFAIVDGQCFATAGGKLLANANIGGSTTRAWALYSSAGDTMQSLKGKKLAYVATGCNDAGFIDNAMLESEVDPSFFAARTGEKDLVGAIADVVSLKTAQAVFAPVGSTKLTKVFDTGTVPNPAFIELDSNLPAGISDKVAAAVIGYGGAGAITGWTRPSREPYTQLASRLGRIVKSGVLATPEPVRLDAKDVLVDPPTLKESAFVPVHHLFVRPPGDRME